MALSTTATATHVLLKYSKSNPSTAAGGPDEWQHYVNPVLTLILDVKKSHAGELESVRLRIIWTMRHGGDSPSTNVVFVRVNPFERMTHCSNLKQEDMDLLSFASVQPQHVHPAQGLPLKAVYKDSVVGIRYLHPLVVAPGASPVRLSSLFACHLPHFEDIFGKRFTVDSKSLFLLRWTRRSSSSRSATFALASPTLLRFRVAL
jgi:hypothetical protein